MKTLLCCIGKEENKYAREFVEHYKNLGITNICLYDNNDDGGEDFHDSIGEYIDSGFVIIKNCKNIKSAQIYVYNDCYKEYCNEYDWIMFFDFDEFLSFTNDKYKTIDEYLSEEMFNEFKMIHVNWLVYGDNGRLRYENEPLQKRFTKPISSDLCVSDNVPENFHIKSIIRGGLSDIEFFHNSHTITNDIDCCNECGIRVQALSTYADFSNKNVVLKHYLTKTIEEYCDKLIRGYPDRLNISQELMEFLLEERYFKYNIPTRPKINIVLKKLGFDLSKLLPKQNNISSKDLNFFCRI
jgi:hypothetical protein